MPRAPLRSPRVFNNEWVKTPVAAGTTGFTLGRIINRSGAASAAAQRDGQPHPLPAGRSSTTTPGVGPDHAYEGNAQRQHHDGRDDTEQPTGLSLRCRRSACVPGHAARPEPGSLPGSLPVQICLRNGFDPTLLYQLVYQVKDPYVLGAGTAAFRDVGSFFRYAAADDFGTANPIAGKISKAVIRGVSQSGNFTRHYIHLGMNQDEAGRIVHEGAWPIIAGRRVANNSRWGSRTACSSSISRARRSAMVGAVARHGPRLAGGSILDRCNATNTCPKIIEHFGGSEVFALKMTTEWVGTSADADIPLPAQCAALLRSEHHARWRRRRLQREYFADTAPTVPGNNWNAGQPARSGPIRSPRPSSSTCCAWPCATGSRTARRLRPAAIRRWRAATLVDPTQAAMGFPSGVPGVPASIFLPENFVNPVFDYDWGPQFNEFDATGQPDQHSATHQERDQDEGAESRCRRQRAGWRADGAARRAARHVPRLEHHDDGFHAGPGVQLRRRHDPVRAHEGRAPGQREIRVCRWRSGTEVTTDT